MKNNYNNLVRFYNRSLKKLSSLTKLGKNEYKQDILKRRIARLFDLLSGMQTRMKLSTAAAALATGFVLFQPNAANAQVFAAGVQNPFSLTAVPTATAWSTPWFVDLDNDGDKDIMSGDKNGDFFYYKNKGTAAVPNFSTSVMNTYSLTGTGDSYSAPVFVDIDNDGDQDLFTGSGTGGFFYYKNKGTASAPSFSASVMNPFGITAAATGYSAGSFVDLDNDGDKDLMYGDKNGDYYYQKNTGTATAPTFSAAVMNPFGLAINTNGYSTATFVDIDKDGDKDMFSGDGPDFLYFQNTGTATAPAFAAGIANPFSLAALTNNGASLSFADLDNDTDMDLISGIAPGDLWYFQNTSPLGITQNTQIGGLSLYPNPTTKDITINMKGSDDLSVEITNAIGQVMSTSQINSGVSTVELPEAKGIYFVKVTEPSGKANIFKVVKN